MDSCDGNFTVMTVDVFGLLRIALLRELSSDSVRVAGTLRNSSRRTV